MSLPSKTITAANNRIKNTSIAGYRKVQQPKNTTKRLIAAPSKDLIKAVVNESKKVSVPSVVRRSSTEAIELTEDNFYEHMKKYLLSDSDMWDNKYPRLDPDTIHTAIVKDYVPQTTTLKRVCCRCGKEYYMNAKGKYVTREECNYHWGKLLRKREKGSVYRYFSCCQADASGPPCSLCRLHVSERVGPLTGYRSTFKCDNEDAKRKVFSLDCEMCYTSQGLELTRLTVVDFHLDQVIDLFVKPKNPIVDYNTRFSGVTKEQLQDVTTSLSDIHDILCNLFDKDTILMGHSLESDLKALKMVHKNVVDTALVFPHRLGLPFKRALRNLMAECLQKIIQDGEGGHDSCEDARACMQLMKYKFNEDTKKLSRAMHTVKSFSSSVNFRKNDT